MDPKLRLVTTEPDSSETEAKAPARELNANERAAAEVAALLDEVAARIPQLTGPDPDRKMQHRGARTVRREYVLALVDTVETHLPDSMLLELLDPAAARDTLEFHDAFRPVARRLLVLLQSLNYTLGSRWAEMVDRVLKAYAMAQAVATAPGHETLAAKLDLVAAELNRKGKPKTKKNV